MEPKTTKSYLNYPITILSIVTGVVVASLYFYVAKPLYQSTSKVVSPVTANKSTSVTLFDSPESVYTEEIKTKHPLDFFIGEEKIILEERINEVFERGESSAEANFISKDGTQTPYFFTGKKIMLGDLECLVGMGIDISNRLFKK